MNNIVLPIDPILRRPIVERIIGDSRSTIYRKIQRRLFPAPICTGRNKNGTPVQVGWLRSEVSAIVKARAAGKTDDEIKQLVIELEAARIAQVEVA